MVFKQVGRTRLYIMSSQSRIWQHFEPVNPEQTTQCAYCTTTWRTFSQFAILSNLSKESHLQNTHLCGYCDEKIYYNEMGLEDHRMDCNAYRLFQMWLGKNGQSKKLHPSLFSDRRKLITDLLSTQPLYIYRKNHDLYLLYRKGDYSPKKQTARFSIWKKITIIPEVKKKYIPDPESLLLKQEQVVALEHIEQLSTLPASFFST
mgnify:FL=1